MIHHLKIDPAPLDALLSGAKTGEVRRDDRGFTVGDTVRLTCADGREAERRITHIQRGYGLPEGMCVLSYANQIGAENACPSCGGTGHYGDAACRAFDGPAGDLVSREAAMREAGHNLRVFVSMFAGRDEAMNLALQEWDAALSTPAAASPQGWRPIETAPQEGETVILWVVEDYNGQGHMLWPCRFLHGDWCWEISDNRNLDYDYEIIERCRITHWMPLPEPPALPLPNADKGEA